LAWEWPFLLVKASIVSVAVTVAVSVAVAMVVDCCGLSSMRGMGSEGAFKSKRNTERDMLTLNTPQSKQGGVRKAWRGWRRIKA
jgi:hypothetical protein